MLYFYDEQIRRYILQFIRLFSEFSVKMGKDDAGNDVNVPEDLDMTVIVDLNDPILWGNITAMEAGGSQRTEWFQDGDTIAFIAEIIEDESVIINKKTTRKKKDSEKVGEYIDFEELD